MGCNKCGNSCGGCEQKCNPCSKQCKLYYCGRDKPCLDVEKGDELSSVISTIIDEICDLKEVPESVCDLNVTLVPTSFLTQPTDYIILPVMEIQGGTAPFNYKWSIKQTGGSLYSDITNVNSSAIPVPDGTDGTYALADFFLQGNVQKINMVGTDNPLPAGSPLAQMMPEETNKTLHITNVKLEVTDANGCKSSDYWTWYTYNNY